MFSMFASSGPSPDCSASTLKRSKPFGLVDGVTEGATVNAREFVFRPVVPSKTQSFVGISALLGRRRRSRLLYCRCWLLVRILSPLSSAAGYSRTSLPHIFHIEHVLLAMLTRSAPFPFLLSARVIRAHEFKDGGLSALPAILGMPQAARMISTGSPEWRTTLSVTLPNTQRLTPERPWVHMAMKLSSVLRASAVISSAP